MVTYDIPVTRSNIRPGDRFLEGGNIHVRGRIDFAGYVPPGTYFVYGLPSIFFVPDGNPLPPPTTEVSPIPVGLDVRGRIYLHFKEIESYIELAQHNYRDMAMSLDVGKPENNYVEGNEAFRA